MTAILAFSAKKQGGKTTAVESLKRNLTGHGDVVMQNFADALKIIIARTFVPTDWLPKEASAINWVEENKNTVLPCGLTVRAMLQTIGTDVFRAIWSPVWINAWKHRLPPLRGNKSPQYIFVADVRFPDEVKAVQEMGGKVIRFTRAPFALDDQHSSETALDNFTGFDLVIDNSNMSIEEQNEYVWEILQKKGWL